MSQWQCNPRQVGNTCEWDNHRSDLTGAIILILAKVEYNSVSMSKARDKIASAAQCVCNLRKVRPSSYGFTHQVRSVCLCYNFVMRSQRVRNQIGIPLMIDLYRISVTFRRPIYAKLEHP